MLKKFTNSGLLLAIFALAMFGCRQQTAHDHDHDHDHGDHSGHQHAVSPPADAAGPARAVAVLSPTEGNQVQGRVTFTRQREGIRVVAEITGLMPNGVHGFHIHEHGDCSAPDAMSAGGHFNPTDQPHAGPDAAQRHVGDLGNLQADENGVARLDRIDRHLSFSGETSIIGRSVIVHAGPDDFTSQPAGDAGPRVACGIINEE